MKLHVPLLTHTRTRAHTRKHTHTHTLLVFGGIEYNFDIFLLTFQGCVIGPCFSLGRAHQQEREGLCFYCATSLFWGPSLW